MKLVIEIDEKYYTDIKESEHCGNYSVLYALDAIRNGTPLPKGHGKLKDVDAFLQKVKKDREHAAYTRSWDADDVLSALDKTYAPTIIEADGGGEDEVSD